MNKTFFSNILAAIYSKLSLRQVSPMHPIEGGECVVLHDEFTGKIYLLTMREVASTVKVDPLNPLMCEELLRSGGL